MYSGCISVFSSDVTDSESLSRAVTDACEQCEIPVSVLVCSAGVTAPKLIQDTDSDTFKQIMDINVLGSFNAVKVSSWETKGSLFWVFRYYMTFSWFFSNPHLPQFSTETKRFASIDGHFSFFGIMRLTWGITKVTSSLIFDPVKLMSFILIVFFRPNENFFRKKLSFGQREPPHFRNWFQLEKSFASRKLFWHYEFFFRRKTFENFNIIWVFWNFELGEKQFSNLMSILSGIFGTVNFIKFHNFAPLHI